MHRDSGHFLYLDRKMIVLQDIHKQYGRVHANNGICMTLEPGKIYALVGGKRRGQKYAHARSGRTHRARFRHHHGLGNQLHAAH